MSKHAKTAILAMVAAFIVAPVYGAQADKSSRFSALVQKALKTGEDALLEAPMARLVELEEMPCQHFFVPASSTTDGLSHQLHLLVDESSSTKKLTPRMLVLDRISRKDEVMEAYLFRTDLVGDLKIVARIVGRIDQGREVEGSGVVSHPPLDSPEVRALFQHELDFWLKNAYRKPSKPKKLAP